MSESLVWTLLVGIWVLTSLAGGAALAWLAKRIHPGLSWQRLWIVYSGLLGFMVAAVMAIALL
ncbi:MAG: hypothetical protein R3314_13495 [Longimicrobiales bacterium]|nr:hypothetical protein [Longimicrobiales bacterium]